jgi:membrane protease YdiL (CAAX protease family)
MALLPAISEEAFFRGTIQNIFLDFRYTPLAAIVLSGLFFATMHMEFDNLLAIWCMGIVLGLLILLYRRPVGEHPGPFPE